MKLVNFYGRNVTVILTDGSSVKGTVNDYIYPEDNENRKESIIIDTNSGEIIELYEHDMLSISVEEQPMAKRIQKSSGGGDFHVTIDSLNRTDDVTRELRLATHRTLVTIDLTAEGQRFKNLKKVSSAPDRAGDTLIL